MHSEFKVNFFIGNLRSDIDLLILVTVIWMLLLNYLQRQNYSIMELLHCKV